MTRIFRYLGLPLVAGGLFLSVLWTGSPQPVRSQTAQVKTTTSAAMTATDTSVALTSDTGVAAGTYLYIDGELLRATSEVGTTSRWNVQRGQSDGMTPAVRHLSGANVWVMATGGAGESYYTFDAVSGAACTSSEYQYLPRINPKSGQVADCEGGFWMARHPDRINVRDFTVRDTFEGGQTIMTDAGTAKGLADADQNFVYGSPLGAIEYREDVAKTASSWIAINGDLEISGDDAAESVEIVFGASSDAALNQVWEVGTSGGCVAMMVTISAITSIDELHIGVRQNEAFVDVAAYATYDEYATIGLVDNAGDLDAQDEEAGAGIQNDDTGVTWAAGERRALKVCLSKAGVPTFFYSAASPDADYPMYSQVSTTNTGDALTSGDGMVPFIVFTGAGVAGTVAVQWVELTRFP